MIRTMKRDIEYLRKHYGNHSKVARELGVTPEHYRRLRNQSGGSQILKNLIVLKVKELKVSKLSNV